MKTGWRIALCALLVEGGVAAAGEMERPEEAAGGEGLTAPLRVHAPTPVQPTTPPPALVPPAPPLWPPPRPRGEAEHRAQTPGLADPGASADGQWVCTSQYGWVFMPYGAQYAYDSIEADRYPYAYVYYPGFGWVWVAAPWVWGEGPYPYFGGSGPWRFAWYQTLDLGGSGWGDNRGGAPRAGVPAPPAGKRETPRPGGFGGPRGRTDRDAPAHSSVSVPSPRQAAPRDDGPMSRGPRSVGGGVSSPAVGSGANARGASMVGHNSSGSGRASGSRR
jgi:hypothetical protein